MKAPTLKPLAELGPKELQFIEQELESHIRIMNENLAGITIRLEMVRKLRERAIYDGNRNALG